MNYAATVVSQVYAAGGLMGLVAHGSQDVYLNNQVNELQSEENKTQFQVNKLQSEVNPMRMSKLLLLFVITTLLQSLGHLHAGKRDYFHHSNLDQKFCCTNSYKIS